MPVVTDLIRANVRVLLVGTRHPGNLGAAARALKTMGLRRLDLVAPDVAPDAESVRLAAHALDVLEQATRHQDLDAALADCTFAVATSARDRRLGPPVVTPREAAPAIVHAARSGPVALVFGREPSGLTNAEIQRCQLQVRVPSDPDYGSLNLAATVQLLAYEVRVEALRAAEEETLATAAKSAPASLPEGSTSVTPARRTPPSSRDADGHVPARAVRRARAATQDEMERLLDHLMRTLTSVGYHDPLRPRLLLQRLRRLLVRAQLEDPEVRLLRGMLAAVERTLVAVGTAGRDCRE